MFDDYFFNSYDTKSTGFCLTTKGPTGKLMKILNSKVVLGNLVGAVSEQIEICRDHFEKDGWDLDARSLVAHVLYDIFGEHIEEAILDEITANTDTVVEYRRGGPFLITPRTFVWYNAKIDKMVANRNRPSKNYELIEVL